jgi:MYXO-CTERM domain-containing protein
MLVPSLVALLGTTASAETQVSIEIGPMPLVAPATVALTASVSSDNPVLSYRWSGLDVAPRCRRMACSLPVNIASCRMVSVEVTALDGSIATDRKPVCVDGAGGHPPVAELTISDPGGTAPLSIATSSRAGSDQIRRSALFVDDSTVTAPSGGSIPRDGGCHAVDLVVVDAAGRIGIDQENVCTSNQAPALWLGAHPSPVPIQPAHPVICAEAEDPLGRSLEGLHGQTSSCGASLQALDRLTRTWSRVRAGSVESTASLFVANAPPDEPRALFFAFFPTSVIDVQTSGRIDADPILTGKPPYTITNVIVDGAAIDPGTLRLSNGHLSGDLPHGSQDSLRVAFTDARGLAADATAKLYPLIESNDGGTNEDGGSPPPGRVGCSASDGPGSADLAWLLLGIGAAVLSVRRRR